MRQITREQLRFIDSELRQITNYEARQLAKYRSQHE